MVLKPHVPLECDFAFKEEDFPIGDQNLDQRFEYKPFQCLKI